MPRERPNGKATPNPTRATDRQKASAVAVIGVGRLGTALAIALAARGYMVRAVVARRISRARRAADLISLADPPRALSAAQIDLLPVTELLFITTPDDRVAETAARLAATPPAGEPDRRRRIALHMSGALSSEALSALRARGFAIGSMHPLVAISDPVAGAESLRGAFYCLEGDAPATGAARRVIRALGGEGFSLRTRDKALYHAAAVMASGHIVALFDVATELLARCGLSRPRARRVLLPLLRSTLDNLTARDPARALTGTFARADVATVRRHLAALSRQRLPDTTNIYTLLGERSLQLAKESGADALALQEIARALKKNRGSKLTG